MSPCRLRLVHLLVHLVNQGIQLCLSLTQRIRGVTEHRLGRVFHAPPNVLHYGRPGTGAVLEEGMFFTIEPMVNLGRPETKVLGDDWTAVTRDRSLSAQFEHSVGVTSDGVEIFTLSPAGRFFPTWSA